jgi:hypothetical protein
MKRAENYFQDQQLCSDFYRTSSNTLKPKQYRHLTFSVLPKYVETTEGSCEIGASRDYEHTWYTNAFILFV